MTIDEAGIPRPDPLYPWLWWGGRLAILIEAAIGLLLLVPPTRRLGAGVGGGFVVLAASGLVALTFITGRDLTSMCGCFGPFELPLAAHLSFDGALLGLLLWTHRLSRPVASETGEAVDP